LASSGSEAAGARGRLRTELAARLDWIVGGVVLLLSATGLLVFLQGPNPFDPATYFQAAIDFPRGGANLFTLRIGLTIPVRAAVLAFGASEAALYAIPIATALALAGAVYGTMLVLFRDRVLAAGAALVTVLNPVYLLNASSIFPDTTATATFAAGFFCLVLGAAAAERGGSQRSQTAAVVLAGVLFGWTYLIREFSPILLPAVAAAALLLRYPARRMLLLGGAALATAALELVYGLLRTGNPFLHAERILSHTHAAPGRHARVENIQSQLDSVLDTAAVFPRLLLAWQSGWLLLVLLALFVVALVLVRDRRLWLFAAWLFSFWITMAALGLGSLPSGNWILNITEVRYWYAVLPALAMGGFAGLALLGERFLPVWRGVRAVPVLAAALSAATTVPGMVEFQSCAGHSGWANDARQSWVDLRGWFGSPAADRYGQLWTNWRTHRLVPAYTSTIFGGRLWDGTIQVFEHLDEDAVPAAARRDAVILVDTNHGTPAALADLRGDWRPIFTSADGNMVVLAYRVAPSATAGEWWKPSLRPEPAEPGSCGLSPYERT
jgi:hypothetical protein